MTHHSTTALFPCKQGQCWQVCLKNVFKMLLECYVAAIKPAACVLRLLSSPVHVCTVASPLPQPQAAAMSLILEKVSIKLCELILISPPFTYKWAHYVLVTPKAQWRKAMPQYHKQITFGLFPGENILLTVQEGLSSAAWSPAVLYVWCPVFLSCSLRGYQHLASAFRGCRSTLSQSGRTQLFHGTASV